MMYFTEDVLKFTLYIKNKSAAGRVQPAGSSQPQGSAAYQGGGGGGISISKLFGLGIPMSWCICVSPRSRFRFP